MNTAVSQTAPAPAPSAVRRLQVFVLIDALGWEIIKDRPFLNAELSFRTPLKTVLGYSSGAIPTILTGLQPAQTGHSNLYYYDPEGSPFRWLRFLSALPRKLVDNRYSRKLIKELGRRVLGMGPLFECGISPALLPFFNWVEKKNIYAQGGISNSASIFDLLERRGVSYRVYSYHHSSDREILDRACRDIDLSDAGFFFIYLSEMDHFLHGHCDNRAAVDDRLAWYEKKLREVHEIALRKDPEATLTIISDHGMTPVQNHYDLVAKVERLGFEMPKHYLSVYDSTMARYWFFDQRAREAIIAELERTPCGRILVDSELARLGILFPDRRYGEIVFLLNPGWLIATSDFNGSGWNPVGMHGYHPSDPHSDAIFLCNHNPGRQMSNIADIYLCMEQAAI